MMNAEKYVKPFFLALWKRNHVKWQECLDGKNVCLIAFSNAQALGYSKIGGSHNNCIWRVIQAESFTSPASVHVRRQFLVL
jgi:hypothetical protein